jgi:uncharacterized protein (DUF2267 family)
MKDDEFFSAIKTTSGIDDTGHCREAVRATLSVLGQRVAGGQTHNLAAQLPGTVASYLPPEGAGESFSVEEFYERVGQAEGCDAQQARKHARAVMAAIRSAVEPGEFDDLTAQLPAAYADLLGISPVQH